MTTILYQCNSLRWYSLCLIIFLHVRKLQQNKKESELNTLPLSVNPKLFEKKLGAVENDRKRDRMKDQEERDKMLVLSKFSVWESGISVGS